MTIFYQCLRGKVADFAPAAANADGSVNPHLWVVVEAAEHKWFATINVRSDKEPEGAPPGHAYLYYFIDADFSHPIVPSILSRPEGLSPSHAPMERNYDAGALDYQRGNLFDPAAMRVLQPGSPGEEGLLQRLQSLFGLAKQQAQDVIFYGRTFKMQKPHQTDAAFGYTPDGPFGLHNVHMAQGDPPNAKVREVDNGVWGDGACFLWNENAKRMTAIFLAFQAQGWHTDANGAPVAGATGCEPPRYDFADGGAVVEPPPRAAELTSAHRTPEGAATAVVANMGATPLALKGWTLTIDAGSPIALPEVTVDPGKPLAIDLPPNALAMEGGVLTLADPQGLRVDGVAYKGGDPAKGFGDTFR